MRDSGRAAIRQSNALGLWKADADVDALRIPDDLQSALVGAQAKANFGNAAPSYRRNVLRWIKQAKKPETRARRIARTVECSRRDERVPQM